MDNITITEDNVYKIRKFIERKILEAKDICSLSFRKIEKKCYEEGLILINEALKFFPNELVLWNNRSVCYCELGYFIEALKDGQEMAVRFPGKINSYYRMAEAYRGLHRFKDAVLCYEEVLKRDCTCVSAAARLRDLRIKHMGIQNAEEATATVAGNAVPSPSEIGGDVYYSDEDDDEWKPCPVGPVGSRSGDPPTLSATATPTRPYVEPAATENVNGTSKKVVAEGVDTTPKTYSKVAATNCCPNSKLTTRPVMARSKSPPEVGSATEENTVSGTFFYNVNHVDEKDPCTDPNNPLQATSIWIGNVYKSVDKDMLYPFFQKIGNVINIVVYHAQTCAFVNFENPKAAGRAMRELQGLTVNGVKLLLRYPDRFASKNVGKPKYAAAAHDPISKRVGVFSNKKFHNGKH